MYYYAVITRNGVLGCLSTEKNLSTRDSYELARGGITIDGLSGRAIGVNRVPCRLSRDKKYQTKRYQEIMLSDYSWDDEAGCVVPDGE